MVRAQPGLVGGDDAVVDAHGDPLAGPDRQRRIAGDPFGERKCGVHRGAVGHDLVDHPPLERIGRRHRLAGEQQFHRDLARQVVDDAERSTGGGDQATLDLGQPEPGPLLGDDEIAGQRQLGAATEGGAVDGGDGRFVDVMLHVAREAPVAMVGVEQVLPARDGLQIGSRAEGFTGTGDHHGAHFWIVLRLLQRVTDRGADRGVDGVARLGAVDRDEQDVAPPLGESGGGGRSLGHSSSRMVALAWPPPSHMVCRPY